MFVKQSDLFRGLDRDFIKKIMDSSTQVDFEDKGVIFRQGEPADAFYILLRGRVRLSIGETGHVVYNVSHAGELFGWSTLMGRETYSATAMCSSPVKAVAISQDALSAIADSDSSNGLVFYRRIARMLGNRLIESYNVISSAFSVGDVATQATGQLGDDSTVH